MLFRSIAVVSTVGVVGRLDTQFAHALEDGVDLVHGAFSGLDHGDAVLRVASGLIEPAHLILQAL